MSKFIVVVLPSEAKAYEGVGALRDLHAEGSLTLYAMGVIAKDSAGKVSMKEAADSGPLGTAVGALIGGLLGDIGGPAGALAGMAGGALLGSVRDVFFYGASAEFLRKVSDELAPGKTAVVAEVAENWTTPLDVRMEALGGTVLRSWRADFEDEQIEKEITERRADLAQLKTEYSRAKQEVKATVKARLDKATADLQRAEERAKSKLQSLQAETRAKISALEQQLTAATDEARNKIKARIAGIRADQERRSAKLNEAWRLTKEALAA